MDITISLVNIFSENFPKYKDEIKVENIKKNNFEEIISREIKVNGLQLLLTVKYYYNNYEEIVKSEKVFSIYDIEYNILIFKTINGGYGELWINDRIKSKITNIVNIIEKDESLFIDNISISDGFNCNTTEINKILDKYKIN